MSKSVQHQVDLLNLHSKHTLAPDKDEVLESHLRHTVFNRLHTSIWSDVAEVLRWRVFPPASASSPSE